MRVATILRAIDALNKAERFLMLPENYLAGGINLSGECFIAMSGLKAELMAEMPEKVELEKDEK